jgi:hypothetical protein
MEEDAQTSRHVGYPPVLGEDLSGWLNSLQSEQQYATMTSLAARKRRPHLIKALCERGSVPNRLTAGEVERLRLMTDTVMAAPEIYRPSKFWQAFNEFAIAHLRIGVRDTEGADGKNPFKYQTVKARIESALWPSRGKFMVAPLPNITHVFYGRDVGYVVERLHLDEATENISATKLRRDLTKTDA